MVKFVNEFVVPVGIDRAFEILTDLERVAPCLPGATLEEVDGATYLGQVKVKVGPIAVTYRGTAELTEADATAKHAVIHAAGQQARGTGTASADVTADLVSESELFTKVKVVTDLAITGKPAQFGRGVMEDVGTKLIDTFADRLSKMIEEDQAGAASAGDRLPHAVTGPTSDAGSVPAPDASVTGGGPRKLPRPARGPESLDLMDVAGGAIWKRFVPVAAAVAIVGIVLWWRRG